MEDIKFKRLEEVYHLMAQQADCIFTHGGKFHADDVFACALAELVFYWAEDREDRENAMPQIYRGNPEDPTSRTGGWKSHVSDKDALLLDVGFGRFDHHQKEKQYYPDGVEKSAVAKFWDYIGLELIQALGECTPEIAQTAFVAVTNRLIKPISDTDTKGQKARPNPISRIVYAACAQAEDNELNYEFSRTVESARLILWDEIAQSVTEAQAAIEALQYASQWASEGHADWGFVPKFLAAESFEGTDVKCIVGKSARGGYNVACVDSARWPIPDSLSAPQKGHFWANYPDQKSAEEAAAWLAQFWAKENGLDIDASDDEL